MRCEARSAWGYIFVEGRGEAEGREKKNEFRKGKERQAGFGGVLEEGKGHT